jgi:hypothetical protein
MISIDESDPFDLRAGFERLRAVVASRAISNVELSYALFA